MNQSTFSEIGKGSPTLSSPLSPLHLGLTVIRIMIIIQHQNSLYPVFVPLSHFPPPPFFASSTSFRDGKHERLSQMNEQVSSGLKAFVVENSGSADLGVTNDSVVAGAMAMSLCYINKIRKVRGFVYDKLY